LAFWLDVISCKGLAYEPLQLATETEVSSEGEDYLYPRSHFAEIVLPKAIRKAVLAAG
jgi:hypothetical protein